MRPGSGPRERAASASHDKSTRRHILFLSSSNKSMDQSFPYQLHTFDSGLRLVTVPMQGTKTATVYVLVGTGSKYETKDINGISHFLEHMMFKGTTKRPNKIQISKELDGIGAEYNAFTTDEYTGYYARAASSKLDVIADVVFDIFLNSTIPGEEVDMEKQVIIEEINMYRDNPQRHIWDVFRELLYGDQPAGWDVAGTKETVSAMTQEKLADYFHEHYIAANTIVAVAGDIDSESVKEKVGHYFSNVRTGQKMTKLPVVEKQSAPQAMINWKETDQSNFIIGFRSYNMFDVRKYAESILATVLGGWMSSRLFIEVRDKRGLAYHIESDTNHESDSGFFYIYAGVNNSKIEEAIKVVMDEVAKVKREGITSDELQKAKDYLEGHLTMALENSRAVAQTYAAPVLFENKVLTPEEELAKIKAVTLEDVLKVAKDIFREDKLNFSVIGPFKDEQIFKNLLKIN